MKKLSAITLTLSLTIGMLWAAAVQGAKPVTVRAGNLVVKLNGGVSPQKLPKRRQAPVALRISANIASRDGSPPPAARRVVTLFDKHGSINARGLATCRGGQLQARSTRAAKRACPKAIVGSGRTNVQVAFPESTPFRSSGPLVLFNGGVRRRVTTLFIHAYVNVPVPTAIVTRVKIKRVRKGRYGTSAVARIPVIAGGSGSVRNFNLKIRRTFRHRGQRRSYLTARCGRGRFFARGTVVFRDGTRLAGTVVRPCRVRG